jgi:N-acetylated-alpha-linked acidic dipeptidase
MPDEHSPLIAVVRVDSRPRQRRLYPHNRVRRCCTCILGSLVVVSLTAIVLTLFFVPACEGRGNKHDSFKTCIPKHPFYRHHNTNRDWYSTEQAPVDIFDILQNTPDESKVKQWSQYYTSGPHLAGKNLSQAKWTQDRWHEFGIPATEIVSYEVYVNYPVDHRLALLEDKAAGSSSSTTKPSSPNWKVKYEARLEEDVLEEDSTTALEDRIPTFHGYSASGNVTASYVFVNYGTYADFEDLVAANVSLKGNIALAKYGKIFRGLKVKRAQELGMVGCVIYSDPGDDGEVTDENGNKTYPAGPARNPSSVQRGSVQYICEQNHLPKKTTTLQQPTNNSIAIAPGDPTTPGYPSKPGCPRVPANHSTPSIPSLPISYLDAIPILKALKGHGPRAKTLGKAWKDGGLAYQGVEYYVGPSPDSIALNLWNQQEYVTTPMWNVIGVINGTLSDEVIVLGNHRDAWIAGGAGDPNSGSAALNEVVRSFGAAVAKGWKPLRTIVFASWDGEEYALIGSTEWVEEYLPWLNATVVAYLNVDVGTTGPRFKASASPLLEKPLIAAAKMVLSPNQTVPGQTLYVVWDKRVSTMGSGSDFTAFQDFAGIPSVDMGFTGGRKDAIYQYHSNYDSFHWMENFGDPGWHYHVTVAKMWGLLAAHLSETPIIQFNLTDYADGLARYLASVKAKLTNSTHETFVNDKAPWSPLDKLDGAIARLRNATVEFDEAAAELLREIIEHPLPWW